MNKKPSDLDIYIGKQMEFARRDDGRLFKEIYYAAGISHQQWRKYEQAKNRVHISTLVRIAKAFDLPVMWFLPEDVR